MQKKKQQVGKLMDTLMACTPHYIRCVKPNLTKRANDFDSDMVTNQVFIYDHLYIYITTFHPPKFFAILC